MSLQKSTAVAIDFTGRTGETSTQILAQDPAGTSIGLGRLTGGALGLYNICVGLRSGQTNTGSNNVVIGVDAASNTGDNAVSNSVIIGYSAGKNVALDHNTFVGNKAGEGCSFGSMNCGYGDTSMQATNNGWFNTASGAGSLQNNGNGNQNVAVGAQAMQNVANSNSNTTCGYMAAMGSLGVAIAGDGNCVYGTKAAYNMGTLNNSVAVGAFAGFNNSSGDECIAIGYQAGFGNQMSGGLVAIGSKAAYGCTTGDVVALGQQAAYSLVNGVGNTFLGNQCGENILEGDNNTFVGKNSGGTRGNSNSALGYGALSSASVNRCVSIGSNAGAFSASDESIFVGNGMGVGCYNSLSLLIGMSSDEVPRPPLLVGNMDTGPGGKPGLTCRGNMRIRQNSTLGESFFDDGLVVYRKDDSVTAAWHMFVDNDGNWVFGKNGHPTAVLEGDLSVPDIASLDFTGQHRCRPSASLMEMVKRGVTVVGLPVAGSIVVSSGTVCTAMGKQGQVYSGKEGIAVSQSLPSVELSAKVRDKAVFGIISGMETCTEDGMSRTYNTGSMVAIFQKEPGDDRLVINSLGEGAIWVCNADFARVENGDYVTTSHIPGVAMKQKSDTLRNSTVAKLTVGCDFSLNSSLFECREVVYMGITYRCALLACTFHCG